MADETLTLALHGEVSLDAFSAAIEHWRGLVAALTRQSARGDVEWIIEELAAGSATATIRAVTKEPGGALPIISAYIEVGQALQQGRAQLLDKPVRDEAVALTKLIDGAVDFIRLETASEDLIITGVSLKPADPKPLPEMKSALGGVQGRIQTLTSRGALRFTLFDTLFDRAVNCYLAQGQEEIMRDVWGETAIVEGLVTRAPDSGRPLNVRDVWNVTSVRHVARYAYAEARGTVRVEPGDLRKPEEIVSIGRDVFV